MRTTIRMNEELARRAKRRAGQQNITFTRLIEEAVRDYLSKPAIKGPRKRIELPVAGNPNGPKLTEQDYRRLIEEIEAEDNERIFRNLRGGK